jgi:hypothetical protein
VAEGKPPLPGRHDAKRGRPLPTATKGREGTHGPARRVWLARGQADWADTTWECLPSRQPSTQCKVVERSHSTAPHTTCPVIATSSARATGAHNKLLPPLV